MLFLLLHISTAPRTIRRFFVYITIANATTMRKQIAYVVWFPFSDNCRNRLDGGFISYNRPNKLLYNNIIVFVDTFNVVYLLKQRIRIDQSHIIPLSSYNHSFNLHPKYNLVSSSPKPITDTTASMHSQPLMPNNQNLGLRTNLQFSVHLYIFHHVCYQECTL